MYIREIFLQIFGFLQFKVKILRFSYKISFLDFGKLYIREIFIIFWEGKTFDVYISKKLSLNDKKWHGCLWGCLLGNIFCQIFLASWLFVGAIKIMRQQGVKCMTTSLSLIWPLFLMYCCLVPWVSSSHVLCHKWTNVN